MCSAVRLGWAWLLGPYLSAKWVNAYTLQIDSEALGISGSGGLSNTDTEERGSSLVRKETTLTSGASGDVSHLQLLEQAEEKASVHETGAIPGLGSALNSVKNLAGAAAGMDKNQYVVWAPHLPPSPRAEQAKESAKSSSGVVSGLVSQSLDTLQSAWESAAQAPKFCLVVNEGVSKSEGQIQIQQCDKASFLKSQFILPEPGEVGLIKQKGKPENCIGVSRQWWGSGVTDRQNPTFVPNVLEITKCKDHVSEHNDTWLVPAANETTGETSGLIVWATHTEMCMDLQDHVEEIEEVQEGDEGTLLQEEEQEDDEKDKEKGKDDKKTKKNDKKKGDDKKDKKKDKDKVKIDGEENVRTFDGNLVTLAPCIRVANWTLQATTPVTLAGGFSAAKGLLR